MNRSRRFQLKSLERTICSGHCHYSLLQFQFHVPMSFNLLTCCNRNRHYLLPPCSPSRILSQAWPRSKLAPSSESSIIGVASLQVHFTSFFVFFFFLRHAHPRFLHFSFLSRKREIWNPSSNLAGARLDFALQSTLVPAHIGPETDRRRIQYARVNIWPATAILARF